MVVNIQDASPAQLIEVGFSAAYQAQQAHHRRWRVVNKRLQQIRGNETPHDAGDNDVYFDLILRQMEDEHAQYIAKTGFPCHPDSRTRIQTQLTRYWVVSVGEMLRATRNGIESNPAIKADMTELVDRFGAIRMMIAKQDMQVHKMHRPDTIMSAILVETKSGGQELSCERIETPIAYQVNPLINRETGSICFPVYDPSGTIMRNDDRRGLSDLLLEEFS